MKTNPNDLAFSPTSYADVPELASRFPQHGLTKREYFAAMFLQGLCSDYNTLNTYTRQWKDKDDALKFAYKQMAFNAVELADALTEQLNKIDN